MVKEGHASILIGAIIISTLASYFVVSMVPRFPLAPPVSGTILQSVKTSAFTSKSYEDSYAGSTYEVEDQTINIATRGNSRIRVEFDANYQMYVSSDTSGDLCYNITLGIEGVGNHTKQVGLHAASEFETYYESLHITYESGILPSRSYKVAIWVYIINDCTITTALAGLIFQNERLLIAQEIAG